jgi:general stress protein 26
VGYADHEGVMAPMPETELDQRYSSPDASATDWDTARERLASAELFWLVTVRPDGRPHTTPLIAVWHDRALYFTTGPAEQKAKNLAGNQHCTLITGSNSLHDGLDLIVEGVARRVTDDAALQQLAAAYESKYGDEWHFDVGDGVFVNAAAGEAFVYEVAPVTAYGFGKGTYSHTRWSFG